MMLQHTFQHIPSHMRGDAYSAKWVNVLDFKSHNLNTLNFIKMNANIFDFKAIF